MRETLKAFVILERARLITNPEKAARALGIWEVASKNSNDALWEMASAPETDPAPGSEAPKIVGSEPVLMIETEKNPDFDPTAPPPSPVRRKAPASTAKKG